MIEVEKVANNCSLPDRNWPAVTAVMHRINFIDVSLQQLLSRQLYFRGVRCSATGVFQCCVLLLLLLLLSEASERGRWNKRNESPVRFSLKRPRIPYTMYCYYSQLISYWEFARCDKPLEPCICWWGSPIPSSRRWSRRRPCPSSLQTRHRVSPGIGINMGNWTPWTIDMRKLPTNFRQRTKGNLWIVHHVASPVIVLSRWLTRFVEH